MIFSKLKENLKKTKEGFDIKISNIFSNKKDIDEILDEIEEVLILSDVGVNTSTKICENIRKKLNNQIDKSEEAIKKLLKEEMISILDVKKDEEENLKKQVVLIVGVNGVGKTTSIGKITNLYKKEGKKVLLCAADTFRAGAIEQLDIWAKRTNTDIILGSENEDPASVIYKGVKAFNEGDYDILICDTAGRLHNKVNLMAELEKMKKVIDKNIDGASKKTYMVLDATTGTNGLIQAKNFFDRTSLDGLILTKLDSTSKGGVVFSIVNELDIPIKYIGIGEGIDDIEIFNKDEFVSAII